ncbi:MAG: YegP family protein [Pseudomonadaceae bacterium]|nr:YegP family protein [Pseudomonadaceae bacterium]
MAGKFELYKDKGGKFRFRLKAGNGEIILASQGYASRGGAMNGIKSVQTHCAMSKCFQTKETKAGHRFNLVAVNGRVVGTSETYKSPAACANGIKSVAKNAPKAKIEAV